jgi:ABC-type nitrate/sulfonate/bicarbonate transport system ATPase subunit
MLKVIGILNNQLHMIDHHTIIVGRTGTGKNTILKVVAYLNKMEVYHNKSYLSECIVRCLKG